MENTRIILKLWEEAPVLVWELTSGNGGREPQPQTSAREYLDKSKRKPQTNAGEYLNKSKRKPQKKYKRTQMQNKY